MAGTGGYERYLVHIMNERVQSVGNAEKCTEQ